jgi:hypothetical protein
MLASLPKQVQELLEQVQRVVGPLQESGAERDFGGWPFKAHYLGHDWLVVVHTDRSVLCGLSLGAWLGNRPLMLSIHDTRTSLFGMEPIALGDAPFDAEFRVFGWPEEVLRELLDAPTRQWLLGAYASRDPELKTVGGYLLFYLPLRNMAGPFALSSGRIPSTDELAQWLQVAAAFADRLTAGFDRAYAAAAASGGPQAAARWLQTQHDAAAARDERAKRVRRTVLGVVLAVVVVVPVLLIAIVVASMLGHGCSIGR